jgi:GT2 family glycosyltransferase
MQTKKKRLIVVLGMHRSGTSAVTRALTTLGVEIGDKLMPPSEIDNPTGFWEDIDIYELNIEILTSIGSNWDVLTPVAENCVATLKASGHFLKAVELLRRKTSEVPVFGFKDPRVAKLLPFWSAVFAHCHFDVSYVLTVRHPLSVVKSLQKRNQIQASKAYWLWLGYVIRSLVSSRGAKRLVVDYDQLMSSPVDNIKRIAKYLQLNADVNLVDDFCKNFLDEGLRHTSYSVGDLLLDNTCPPLALEVFSMLQEVASDKLNLDAIEIDKRIQIWAIELERVCSLIALADEVIDQKDRTERLLQESRKQSSTLNAEVVSRGEWGLRLDEELKAERVRSAQHQGQISSLNDEVVRRGEWALGLEEQLKAERARSARSAQHQGQIASLNDEVVRRGEWALGLEEQLKAERARSAQHQGQIASLNDEVVRRGEWALGLEEQLKAERARSAQHQGQIASLNDEVVRRGEWALGLQKQLDAEQARSLSQISSLNDEIVRRGEWGIRLDQELLVERQRLSVRQNQVSSLSSQISANRIELDQLRTALHDVTNSYCWRLTAPARGFQWFLPLVARGFNNLPIHRKTKDKIAFTMFRAAPSLFESLESFKAWKARQEWIQAVIASAPHLTVSERPVVSIIIPIYGQIDYTLRCLASIANNAPNVPIEIIVVDDCSPDDSVEILSQRQGIKLIKNTKNHGFIRTCNRGANFATGKYLHFLNNDTEVTLGWLDALLRTFEEFPGTGLVGSKLIYPDGRLQEAGAIIWRDGSAWNFGRLQSPDLPIYNYAREVDYCSAASVMVPRELFQELGGFDEHYLPAYCEDSDLALKIRDKGYRVIYQSTSKIIHYEGITSGTDTSQGAKAYQITNSRKLIERWSNRLQQHQSNGVDVDTAKDRMAQRRVLVIEVCTPEPNQDAGSVTVVNLILLLREMGFQVTFIPEDNYLYMPDYTTALQRIGVECLYAPYVTSVEQHVREYGQRYDLAFLFRPQVVEKHIKTIRRYCKKAKVLYYTHDLHFLRMNREAELLNDPAIKLAADEMKIREYNGIRQSDSTIVVTEDEYELLKSDFPDSRIEVLPLILNIPGTTKGFKERKDIVFVGGYQHKPNVDAVIFFVEEVMPILRKKLPGVVFHIVGSKPPLQVRELGAEDVVIHGFVDDLNFLLDQMRVSVAPLRYGAGIKGKIGTAMAAGVPVVATKLAAEGMGLTNKSNALICDEPNEMATAVELLYRDENLWDQLSSVGIRFAETSWGSEAAWLNLAKILRSIDIPCERGKNQLTLYRIV